MTATQAQPGPPFVMFGVEHVAALALVGLLSAALAIAVRRSRNSPAVGAGVCRTLAALLLLYAAWWPVHRLVNGEWRVEDSVPLHLCDLAVLVTAAALYAAGGVARTRDAAAHAPARGQWLFELSYYWVVGGTTQALLTPDLRFGFPHFQFLKFFAGHGLSMVGALVLVFGVGRRPRPHSAFRVWVFTLSLLPGVGLFNWLTGSNYMFLCGPPKNPSLFDYFGRWPLSVLTLIVAALVMMYASYAPFWLAGRPWLRRPRSS